MAPGRPAGALGWSFGNTVVSRLGTVVIGVALARILGPSEFGTYAVAFIALVAMLSFNELGVSLAIVRWEDDPATIAPTVTTISLVTSALVTGVVYVAAPAFAASMGDPQAAGLVRLLSLCVLINGIVATPAALLQRYFKQGLRTVADQVNVWVGAFVSVGLALAGTGALGLVVGRLAGAGISAVLFLVFSPLPYRVGLDRRLLRPLLRFGAPLAGASAIVFAVGFMDQVIVGHSLGSKQLGFYVLAFNLASWPVSIFSQPLRNVAPALFSRLQREPRRMTAAFRGTLRPLVAASLPACVAISITSDSIVRFLYGPQWLPAASALRFLALLAALRIFFELAYDYLVVVRRSTTILTIQTLWLVLMLPVVQWGAERYGIAGAAAAQLLVVAVVVVPLYLLALSRVGIRFRDVLAATWMTTLICAGLASALAVLTPEITSDLLLLAVGALLSLGVIGVLVTRWRRDLAAWGSGAEGAV